MYPICAFVQPLNFSLQAHYSNACPHENARIKEKKLVYFRASNDLYVKHVYFLEIEVYQGCYDLISI